MGMYYESACHTCREATMWAKCPIETAEKFHEIFKRHHVNHEVELSNDYDDDFMDRIGLYKRIASNKYEEELYDELV